jgi:K+-sensing histidine kinase KdpD
MPAVLITQSLQPTAFPTPLFFAAIVVSTWFGGIGPGIFAVIFATLLLDYYFVSATRTFAVHPAALLYLAQFSFPALPLWAQSCRRVTRRSWVAR